MRNINHKNKRPAGWRVFRFVGIEKREKEKEKREKREKEKNSVFLKRELEVSLDGFILPQLFLKVLNGS